MKTIIIEDDVACRLLLKDLMSNVKKFDVIADFGTAMEGLEFIKNNAVDLIFLDVEMPGMTGIELARMLPDNIKIVLTLSLIHI